MRKNHKGRMASSDEGFTLVEVIVAMVLLIIVSTASLYFSVRANTASAYQQHNQVAVTLANTAMEQAVSTDSTAALVHGRGQSAVTGAFATNSAKDGVSLTYPLWDSTAATTAGGDLPIKDTDTLKGTVYTTYLIIGSCYRPQATLSGVVCKKATGFSTTPPTAAQASAASLIQEIRVIALVTWTADDECPGGCSYQSSTIIDPNADLKWVG